MLRKFKNFIRSIIFKFVKPEYKTVHNSYSQAGEDAVISFLLWDKKLTDLSYLDLGTNQPNFGNNTYLFYLRGHRGVCVEADAALIPKIREVRPEDKVLNVGVNVANSSDEEADFYIFDEPSLNTFDKEEALNREKQGTFRVVKTDKVKLMSIQNIIIENFDTYPDFLSIDIEGLDLLVLKTLDFQKYPIPIICVETCTYSENHVRPKDESIPQFMNTQGYVVYADTYINTIFVNKNWFYNL